MADLSRERIAELKRDLSDHAKRGNGVVMCDTEEILALLSMAERAVSWTLIDYDDPSTLPSDDDWRLLRYNDGRRGGSGVIRGRWDPDGPRWFDDETDGTNSQLEWPPGFITHWAPWPESPAAEAFAKGTK